MGKFVGDLGAVMHAATIVVGDRLGLYKGSRRDPRPRGRQRQVLPSSDYDLVTMFDCLHDMGDPVGASAHVRESLTKDGTWMIVEPFANDQLESNLNPVGRVFYSASTFICTPASRSRKVGLCLGAQAGEARG